MKDATGWGVVTMGTCDTTGVDATKGTYDTTGIWTDWIKIWVEFTSGAWFNVLNAEAFIFLFLLLI